MHGKFGLHAKRNDRFYRTLKIENYLALGIPDPPRSSNNLSRIYKILGTDNPADLFPMDGNDTYGCCAIAMLAHVITMICAFLGKRVIPPAAEVEKLYFLLTGGEDTGLDLLTVCNYIRQSSWLGEKAILAFAQVNPIRQTFIEQSIHLFGSLLTGFQVQENCIQEFDEHLPWTPGPLTQDGHAVVLADYTPSLVVPLTWGSSTTATWNWERECVQEAYVIIPVEAQEPGYMPGLDLAHLMRDLKVVTA